MDMLVAIALVSSVCASTVGGVFFAFSTFVMRALAALPPAQGIAAMQRINVTVLNPLFLGAFLGTALLLGGAAYAATSAGQPQAFGWLSGAFIVLGWLGWCHHSAQRPLNNKLAVLEPSATESAGAWFVYVREWLFWNHVRCAASLAAAAGAITAIAA
jgi:uncharacterized membrane protein